MAWIESHQSLLTHRKTGRLARALAIDKMTAIGHLHAFWWWAVDNAPTGDLSRLEPADLADGACWAGDATAFVEALVYAGFVDRSADELVIHQWQEYTGRLIEKREANAERMRRARATQHADTNTDRATHVQRTSGARAGATVPNRTVPDPTGPELKSMNVKPDTGEGDGAARTESAADAAPPVASGMPKSLRDAFAALGLRPPSEAKAEVEAAKRLLRQGTADELARCWQDIATCEYGDPWDQRNLSFVMLARSNRFGNWQRWVEGGRAPPKSQAARRNTNGVGRQDFTAADMRSWTGIRLEFDPDDAVDLPSLDELRAQQEAQGP